mmetsp:Transcript_65250/g.206161  ORF Transcript_65250/g.206161 Transcript_65250/m.206161 type:complete len:243 (+) Transcript_65250:97-825(+)
MPALDYSRVDLAACARAADNATEPEASLADRAESGRCLATDFGLATAPATPATAAPAATASAEVRLWLRSRCACASWGPTADCPMASTGSSSRVCGKVGMEGRRGRPGASGDGPVGATAAMSAAALGLPPGAPGRTAAKRSRRAELGRDVPPTCSETVEAASMLRARECGEVERGLQEDVHAVVAHELEQKLALLFTFAKASRTWERSCGKSASSLCKLFRCWNSDSAIWVLTFFCSSANWD